MRSVRAAPGPQQLVALVHGTSCAEAAIIEKPRSWTMEARFDEGLITALEPSLTVPPPQLHNRLPRDTSPSIQEGWDPKEAARGGRLNCLQLLQKEDRFLDMYSPHRAAAGEARRAEAWRAALAACAAGHAHVLRWLFREGWPSSFDADPPWHLGDMAESWIKEYGTVPKHDRRCLVLPTDRSRLWWQRELPCFPPEVELYRSAMRAPACLNALLDAGARSAWICRAAVLEGKADLLRSAVARGCPCDAESLFSAAREGQEEVLKEVLQLGLNSLLHTTNSGVQYLEEYSENRSVASLVQRAGMEAAARGQKACLEALLRWHRNLLCGFWGVAFAAARAGHLNCLQLLDRAGFNEWRLTTLAAAIKPDNLPCLLFALNKDPPSWHWRQNTYHSSCLALYQAARAGSFANLKILHEAGCPWTGLEVYSAIQSGNSEAVKYCLEHVPGGVYSLAEEDKLCAAMRQAIEKCRNPTIMELLYKAGFPRFLMRGKDHPAVLAIACGLLEGAKIAVKYSGVPHPRWLNTAIAARRGQEMLQYVQGLYGTLHVGTAEQAALWGQLGAFRYATESGVPWEQGILEAAVEGDSLDCLRYAHEACPDHMPTNRWGSPAARSLNVLRYVCEHMGPTWRAGVLRATARQLADRIRQAETGKRLDWQLALYTVQQVLRNNELGVQWVRLPAPLASVVRVRRDRAGALARAFYKAGQQGQVRAAHLWAPLWRAMAGLPRKLRQRIAFEAHLVLPPEEP